VHGGIGKIDHILSVTKNISVSGVSLASMLHYHCIKTNRIIDDFEEGNIEFLKSNQENSKIDTMSLAKIKKKLFNNNITCRLI